MRIVVFFLILFSIAWVCTDAHAQESQESIVLSTYYPAPFGEYEELRVTYERTGIKAADFRHPFDVAIIPAATFDPEGATMTTYAAYTTNDGIIDDSATGVLNNVGLYLSANGQPSIGGTPNNYALIIDKGDVGIGFTGSDTLPQPTSLFEIDGGQVATSAGAGKNILLNAQDGATLTGDGGYIALIPGAKNGTILTYKPGSVYIVPSIGDIPTPPGGEILYVDGGTADPGEAGVNIYMKAQNAGGTSPNKGGDIILSPGAPVGASTYGGVGINTSGVAPGGILDVQGGIASSGAGRDIILTAQSGAPANGDGGSIVMASGAAPGSSGNGGSVVIASGASTNGTGGDILLTPGTGAVKNGIVIVGLGGSPIDPTVTLFVNGGKVEAMGYNANGTPGANGTYDLTIATSITITNGIVTDIH